MSEYKTLDQFFPDGKPDGRKFVQGSNVPSYWFIPIFRDVYGTWHGLNCKAEHEFYHQGATLKEYEEPKKTKKVTMYKPVYKGYDVHYRTLINDEWHTDKDNFGSNNVLGWMKMECEVTE
jgi:hypothetical protein